MSKSRLSEKAKENLMRRNTREKGNKLQPNEKVVLEYKPEQIGLVKTEVWSQEDRLFDEMCNSAEIYNANRPYMESSSYGVKISTWFIPTLEDLKCHGIVDMLLRKTKDRNMKDTIAAGSIR